MEHRRLTDSCEYLLAVNVDETIVVTFVNNGQGDIRSKINACPGKRTRVQIWAIYKACLSAKYGVRYV